MEQDYQPPTKKVKKLDCHAVMKNFKDTDDEESADESVNDLKTSQDSAELGVSDMEFSDEEETQKKSKKKKPEEPQKKSKKKSDRHYDINLVPGQHFTLRCHLTDAIVIKSSLDNMVLYPDVDSLTAKGLIVTSLHPNRRIVASSKNWNINHGEAEFEDPGDERNYIISKIKEKLAIVYPDKDKALWDKWAAAEPFLIRGSKTAYQLDCPIADCDYTVCVSRRGQFAKHMNQAHPLSARKPGAKSAKKSGAV